MKEEKSLILNLTSTAVKVLIPDVIREMHRNVMCAFQFKSWKQTGICCLQSDAVRHAERPPSAWEGSSYSSCRWDPGPCIVKILKTYCLHN